MTKAQAFWQRVFSIETARFILALMSLNFAAGSVLLLMSEWAKVAADKAQVVTFAIGQLFALAMMAFGRYFGRGGDEHASGKTGDPVHVEPEPPADKDLPQPSYGKAKP